MRYYIDHSTFDGTFIRIKDAPRERAERKKGRDPDPSAGIIDSQTVKTTEAGGRESCGGRVSRGKAGRHTEGEKEEEMSAHEPLHRSLGAGHMQPVAQAVDAPVDARTGRRALTHLDDPLDLAS